MKGMVFGIARFSIHDGPGIRTTIFLKGCPYFCPWCHNPEGQSLEEDIFFIKERCIECGGCLNFKQRVSKSGVTFRRALAKEFERMLPLPCPTNALVKIGRFMSHESVVKEALKDLPFYKASGGGITISGGEPYFQSEFTNALLYEFSRLDIHTCVETCMDVPWERIDYGLKNLDLIISDIKPLDPDRYSRVVGGDKNRVVENVKKAIKFGKKIILRFLLLRGFGDVTKQIVNDIFSVTDCQKSNAINKIEAIELLECHSLGVKKYSWMGLHNPPEIYFSNPEVNYEKIAILISKMLSEKGLSEIPVRRLVFNPMQ